jgi:hypothetical protein
MDTATRGEAAVKSDGKLSPNEQRKKFYGLGPVKGGDSPLAQQQYYSLEQVAALHDRELAAPIQPATPAQPSASDATHRRRRRRRDGGQFRRDSASEVAGGESLCRVISTDWLTSSC